ncbi:uncharacterized protein LOC105186696 [Harpegnathos saltator]|uniref:uncharacterized protein LOC105186696 n=1 Tax=Harpegnathos saltator TaxID=610380 RepID=UPI000DBEE60F|nr:uncharacterized protein LOC105186696 [Harpegnathos saltator]
MATLRLMTILRRATYFTQDFNQRHVAHKLGVYQFRKFSDHNTITLDNENVPTKPKERPKTVPVPKITLLLSDDSMIVTNLENAQRIAKRRKLNLIKVNDLDSKSSRATYKLTNNLLEETEFVQIDGSNIQCKSESPKLLYISANITKHDLLTKIKNVTKMLNKGNKVKICISVEDAKDNNILPTITDMVKDIGSILKQPSKKNIILLIITPLNRKDANNSVNNI